MSCGNNFVENDDEGHAEDYLIGHMEILLNSNHSMMPAVNTIAVMMPSLTTPAIQTMSSVTTQAIVMTQPKIANIKMYTNYSPCSTCSDKLINFISLYKIQNIRVEFEIIVASPYKCMRTRCFYCSKPNNLRNLKIYADNARGLRKLMATPGVILRSFVLVDWLYLATKLGVVAPYVYDLKFPGRPGIPDHRLVCLQLGCMGCVNCVRRDSRCEADNKAWSDFVAIRN